MSRWLMYSNAIAECVRMSRRLWTTIGWVVWRAVKSGERASHSSRVVANFSSGLDEGRPAGVPAPAINHEGLLHLLDRYTFVDEKLESVTGLIIDLVEEATDRRRNRTRRDLARFSLPDA